MPFNKNFGQDTGHDDPDKGGNKPNKPVPGSPGNVGSRGTSRDPNGRWTDAEGRSRRNPGDGRNWGDGYKPVGELQDEQVAEGERRQRGYGDARRQDETPNAPWNFRAQYPKNSDFLNPLHGPPAYDDDFFLGHRRNLTELEDSTIPPKLKKYFPLGKANKAGKRLRTLPASWTGNMGPGSV